MQRVGERSSGGLRILVVLALVAATAIVWTSRSATAAGPPNHPDLKVFDKEVTVGESTVVTVDILDANDEVTDYSGPVTFDSTDGLHTNGQQHRCDSCFSVAPHDAGKVATYTFKPEDHGHVQFTLVWFSNAVGYGTRELNVNCADCLGQPNDTETDIVVVTNDAVSINLTGVEKNVKTGTATPAFVEMLDAAGNRSKTYERRVDFTANCGAEDTTSCFVVTPNDAGEHGHGYTFTPADAGDKRFTLIWQVPGTYKLTVTALLPGNGKAEDSEDGIVVTGTALKTTTTVAGATTTTTAASPLAALTGGATTTTTVAGSSTTAAGGATSTTSGSVQAASLSCDDPRTSTATVTPSSAEPGDDVAVRGACFAPNQQGLVIKFSNPARQLGTTSSDANGRYTTVVRIPTDAAAGSQKITVTGTGGKGGTHDSVGSVTVVGRVSSAGFLAKTGKSLLMLAAAGALIFILGHTVMALGRRLES